MSDEKPPHPLTDEQIDMIAEKAFDRIAMLALALWLVKEGKWS